MEEFKPETKPIWHLISLDELARIQSALAADQDKLSEDAVRALLRLYDGVISACAEVNRLRYYEDQYKSWQREMDRLDIPHETSEGTKLSALGRLVEFMNGYLRKYVPGLKHGTPIALDEGGGMQALQKENARLSGFERLVEAIDNRLETYGFPPKRGFGEPNELLGRLFDLHRKGMR